jgi:hypothetical protein
VGHRSLHLSHPILQAALFRRRNGDRYDPNSAIRNSQSPEDEAEALREEHKSTDSKEKTNSEKADETKMPTLLRSLEVR